MDDSVNTDQHLMVKKADLNKWDLLGRLDQSILNLIKWFKPHDNRLWAALSDGRIIAAGDNSMAGLGVGHGKVVKTYQEITTLRGMSVCKIVAGWKHAMAITEDGQLWGWGENTSGQVGLPDEKRYYAVPNLIVKGVVDVKCGDNFTLVLMEGGKVMGWGENRYGQIGAGNRDHQTKPRIVFSLMRQDIRAIEVGSWHSMMLTMEGEVHGCGLNDSYQLGIGTANNQLLPVLVNVDDKRVESMVCLAFKTVFLTRDRLVYIAGVENTIPCRVNMPGQELPRRLFAIDYVYCMGFKSRELFMVLTLSKLIYWGDTKQGPQLTPLETDSSLSQIITQHFDYQWFRGVLYTDNETIENNNNTQSTGIVERPHDSNSKSRRILRELFDSSTFSDIEFSFPEGASIKAHRNILSTSSSSMCARLSTDWRSELVVSITCHPQCVYRLYVSHLYAHPLPVDLSLAQITQLLSLSASLNEPSLSQACTSLLSYRLSLDNACRLYEMALDHHLELLNTQAFELIRDNFEWIKSTEGFKQMKPEAVRDYVSRL